MEHAWNESLVAKIKLTGNYQDYIIVLLENLGFEAYRSIHKVLNDDGDINIDWIAYQFAEYAKENFTYEYGIASKCKINGKLYNIQNAIKSAIKGTGDNITNDLGFIAYLSRDMKIPFISAYTDIIKGVLELDLPGYI